MSNVLRLAFELMLYILELLNQGDIGVKKAQQLKLLYGLLNDFISSHLEKEKGDLNVTRPKKQCSYFSFEDCR